MTNTDGSAQANELQGVTISLSAALSRLEQVVAADSVGERIAALEREVKEVRAQCTVLIKENATLNGALETSESAKSNMEARHRAVDTQLDNAINQLHDVLTAS